ncbi:VraH family peptide resistance protein [Macrococcus brunensis]|uniref:VraH family peptide resistance protein n=1 Tax=Macrococcus brunensis TaxID=198483 RepID=UPI001EF0F710|nr:VraH family protein [Macrococcus brunensis]ULG71400.1 VraH family protein [Macrococcus brunensis]
MSLNLIIDYLKDKQWSSTDLMYVIIYMVIASLLTTPIFGIPIGLAAFLYFNDKENLQAYQHNYKNRK